MPSRTVRAIRRDDGRLELLDPIELPKGAVFTVTVEVADEPVAVTPDALPTRRLGAMKHTLTRDDLYADRTR